MRKLVLREEDGKLFENIYYLAMSIASPKLASALYDRRPPKDDPLNRYWQNAFNGIGGTENVLVSAIVNTLDMPFGAYVLIDRAPDRLTITPWLLSGKVDARQIENDVMADDVNCDTLLTYARRFALTADFLAWLDKRERGA